MVIKRNTLVVNSGISRSNGNGYFILWPKDPQKSADDLRSYLKRRFNLQCVDVVISDSKTTPLRWGESGIAISYSGFRPLNDYLKKSDIFGHKLKYKKSECRRLVGSCSGLNYGGRKRTDTTCSSHQPAFCGIYQQQADEKKVEFFTN